MRGLVHTLAMAYLLSPEQIADQGLRERGETTRRRVCEAVSVAGFSLQDFWISRQQVQQLVDVHIQGVAEELKPAISRRCSECRPSYLRLLSTGEIVHQEHSVLDREVATSAASGRRVFPADVPLGCSDCPGGAAGGFFGSASCVHGDLLFAGREGLLGLSSVAVG